MPPALAARRRGLRSWGAASRPAPSVRMPLSPCNSAHLAAVLPRAEAATLRGLLQSDAGRAMLSRDGLADQITVTASDVAGDAVIVRFRDRGAPPVLGLERTEWRAFFDVNGRMTTVAIRGLAAAPLGTDDGQLLLARTISAVRGANGVEADSSRS